MNCDDPKCYCNQPCPCANCVAERRRLVKIFNNLRPEDLLPQRKADAVESPA